MNERVLKTFTRYADKFCDLRIEKGTLYIVSTPIGNLEDISFRAIHILRNVDLIASEDTRKTNFLLTQYEIRNKTVSYYSQVEASKLNYLIDELKSGKSVALVSDAGTPSISDPGNLLISTCVENNINMFSIPGASALMHALVLSGFPTKKFYFQGFIPVKKGRRSLFEELAQIKMTIIIYESPFRIYRTIKDIAEFFGNKEISVSRELTKKFEQVMHGKIKSLINQNLKTKGEFVIVINNN